MKASLALFVALGLFPMAQAQSAPPAPPTPAMMAQHQVQRYTTLLSLNPAQVEQATTFFTAEATARENAHANQRALPTRRSKRPSRATIRPPFSPRRPPWGKWKPRC